MHFTENLASVPKKYRKQAIAEASGDITTKDPDVARSVEIGSRKRATIETQDRAAVRAEAKERERQLLTKTSCVGGVPGECGPGRSCVYDVVYYMGKSDKQPGVCKREAEADRMVSESNQQRANQQLINQGRQIKNILDDIQSDTGKINRKLGGF